MASYGIMINIRKSNGKMTKISVPRDCYVEELLQAFADQEGHGYHKGGCPSCSGLYHGCKELNSSCRISQYGIRNGSVVSIMYRFRGGGLASVWYENGALNVGGPKQRRNYSKQIAEFTIPTFRVSCRSDKIGNQNMMGIVIYLCDNKQLFYLNGMKCRSGYILLVNSDKVQNIKGGTMHNKTFKYFVGKDLSTMNIVGGGFSIQGGTPVFRSGTFNASTTKFHDGNREMHEMEKQCITAAINNWKRGTQNTKVSDIYKNGTCHRHGFY